MKFIEFKRSVVHESFAGNLRSLSLTVPGSAPEPEAAA